MWVERCEPLRGSPRTEGRGAGRVSVGNSGGGAKIFFWGPKCPPRKKNKAQKALEKEMCFGRSQMTDPLAFPEFWSAEPQNGAGISVLQGSNNGQVCLSSWHNLKADLDHILTYNIFACRSMFSCCVAACIRDTMQPKLWKNMKGWFFRRSCCLPWFLFWLWYCSCRYSYFSSSLLKAFLPSCCCFLVLVSSGFILVFVVLMLSSSVLLL